MQLTLSIPAWDSVKCSKCLRFHEWNDGKGWQKRQCPVCIREYGRQYRAANSDAVQERKRLYRAANPDAVREWKRRWRAANADAIRESGCRYRSANSDRIRGYNREYRAANPEVRRKQKRNRRALKANAVCVHGTGCFAGAVATLPKRCAVPGCLRRKGLQADHIVPLAGGGLDCKDNLQLLCAHHNSSKGAADPIVWAQRNGRLL